MTAATRECSVERSGVLTMFNGQTSTVAVPCKYRLADIQCGDYRLVVTPGNKLDSDNTFFSRHRLGQHQDYSQRKSVCPNNGPPFAKGQSPGIIFSSVTVPYPDSRVLPAQHSSDCKCLRSSCPYGLRTVQSQQSRQANKQQQQHE